MCSVTDCTTCTVAGLQVKGLKPLKLSTEEPVGVQLQRLGSALKGYKVERLWKWPGRRQWCEAHVTNYVPRSGIHWYVLS